MGITLDIKINSKIWPASEGWVKKAWHNSGVEIHYMAQYENGILKAVDDFKFK